MKCTSVTSLTTFMLQEAVLTKYACFLCEWNSRAKDKYWIQKICPSKTLKVGGKRAVQVFGRCKKCSSAATSPKLAIMKISVKAFLKHGDTFEYLASKFPQLSEAKLKEGVFVDPDIRKLMTDEIFN